MSSPSVVGLVPAWNAEDFIEATLASLASQTYANLRIIISDDASSDRTVEICERFISKHDRFSLIRQKQNLGWVGNVEALIAHAGADYLFIAYHDDLYEPTYVERLVEAVDGRSHVAAAFPDRIYHDHRGVHERRAFTALDGLGDKSSAYDRLATLIENRQFGHYAHRGIIRSDVVERAGAMRRHLGGERGADGVWVLRLAAAGELVRVPEPLIHKHKRAEGLSSVYRKDLLTDLAWHLSCARAIMGTGLTLAERTKLIGQLAMKYGHVTPGRIRKRLRNRL